MLTGHWQDVIKGPTRRDRFDQNRQLGNTLEEGRCLCIRNAFAAFCHQHSVGHFQWPNGRRQHLGPRFQYVKDALGKGSALILKAPSQRNGGVQNEISSNVGLHLSILEWKSSRG